MKLTYITGGCEGGPCPTIYETDRGTLVIQGYVAGKQTGVAVRSVTVPRELLGDAASSSSVRRLTADAVSVSGQPVDPATVEGLGQLAENEALIEIPRPLHRSIPGPRHFDADGLSEWLARTEAATGIECP